MGMNLRRWVAAGAVAVVAGGSAVVLTASGASGAAQPLARAVLLDQSGREVGTVVIKGHGRHATQVQVALNAPGVPAPRDFHGFHIHTTGVCNPQPMGSPTPVPFGSAGGHWNPAGVHHGSHAGDLPSLHINADGTAASGFDIDRFDVGQLFDADGSAVVLHAGRDNFANIPATYESGGVPGPNAATNAAGDAGGRYACGVLQPVGS